ncbi:MAG: hypothetical protein AAFM92_00820 [Pseudomonadota bacterium]
MIVKYARRFALIGFVLGLIVGAIRLFSLRPNALNDLGGSAGAILGSAVGWALVAAVIGIVYGALGALFRKG